MSDRAFRGVLPRAFCHLALHPETLFVFSPLRIISPKYAKARRLRICRQGLNCMQMLFRTPEVTRTMPSLKIKATQSVTMRDCLNVYPFRLDVCFSRILQPWWAQRPSYSSEHVLHNNNSIRMPPLRKTGKPKKARRISKFGTRCFFVCYSFGM